MKLILHSPGKGDLRSHYARAFSKATELVVVSAYLTDWDTGLKLNENCGALRIIVGSDFGITRKSACRDLLKWTPADRKADLFVCEVGGFHPKAVFWKEAGGQAYAILGSSNLSKAAFEKNFEANGVDEISHEDYEAVWEWVELIEESAPPLSEDWLDDYVEARRPKRARTKKTQRMVAGGDLPRPRNLAAIIKRRRQKLERYREVRPGLQELIRSRARNEIDDDAFFERLPDFWSVEKGTRMQRKGWERSGKNSDFGELCRSYLAILDARQRERDRCVVDEIDRLGELGVPTRKALLSELLCLDFPARYAVLNQPIRDYFKDLELEHARGASEGSRYLDLCRKLRLILSSNPRYLAKNLAELDAAIVGAASEF